MWNKFFCYSKRFSSSFSVKHALPGTILSGSIVQWASSNMELEVPTRREVDDDIATTNLSSRNSFFNNESYESSISNALKLLNTSEDRETTEYMDELISQFGNLHNKIVVDVGVGVGYFTDILSKKVGKNGLYIGLDINKSFIYYLNDKKSNNNNVKIGLNTNESLCLPKELSNNCDLMIMNLVLHHCDEPNKILNEIYSYLKPNGKLIVIEFTKKGRDKVNKMFADKHGHQHKHKHKKHKHKKDDKHHQHFNENDMKTVLNEAGFIFNRKIMDQVLEDVIVVEYKKPAF